MASYGNVRPWNMSPRELESWYNQTIEEGSTRFTKKINKSMKNLVRVLHKIPNVNVKEVCKVGSMQKGTFYKDNSDIDCIVILGGIPKLSNQVSPAVHRRRYLKPELEKIHSAFESSSLVVFSEKFKDLQMLVRVKQDDGTTLEIDVLFTADNLDYERLGYQSNREVQRSLEDHHNYILTMKNKDDRYTYQPCLSPLQTEFVKTQHSSVKSLIRLLKFWNAEYLHKRYGEKLINSYALELLAIHVYEKMGSYSFNMGSGFKRVMSLLANDLDRFEFYWTNYYTSDMARRGVRDIQKRNDRNIPVLLDPVDPSNNIFDRWLPGLYKVKQAARDTLNTRLMREIY